MSRPLIAILFDKLRTGLVVELETFPPKIVTVTTDNEVSQSGPTHGSNIRKSFLHTVAHAQTIDWRLGWVGHRPPQGFRPTVN